MSVNITIDDNVLDTIKNALDKAFKIILKAKESANRAKEMAMSKS